MKGNAFGLGHDRLLGINGKRQPELNIVNDFFQKMETLDHHLFVSSDTVLAFFQATTRVLMVEFELVVSAVKFTRSD